MLFATAELHMITATLSMYIHTYIYIHIIIYIYIIVYVDQVITGTYWNCTS